MSSFIRFAGAAAVVLSLGFLVAAIPAAVDLTVPTITGKDAVSVVCANVFVDIEAKIKALLACTTLVDLEAHVKILVAVFQGCADELLKVGANVAVDVEAKASIVACIAAIITLLVKVCVELAVKFGIAVIVKLVVELDIVIKAVLVALNICIPGILTLVAQALSVVVSLLAKIQLNLCLGILGIQV